MLNSYDFDTLKIACITKLYPFMQFNLFITVFISYIIKSDEYPFMMLDGILCLSHPCSQSCVDIQLVSIGSMINWYHIHLVYLENVIDLVHNGLYLIAICFCSMSHSISIITFMFATSHKHLGKSHNHHVYVIIILVD